MAAYKASVTVSVVIPAPLEDVWARVRQFADLSWAGIDEVKWQEEGYQLNDIVVGKHRVVTLGSKHIYELLTSYSDVEHFYTYSIAKADEGVFPGKLANYQARLSFKRVTDTNSTFAEWSSTFETDEASAPTLQQAIENGVYLAGFAKLKQLLATTSA